MIPTQLTENLIPNKRCHYWPGRAHCKHNLTPTQKKVCHFVFSLDTH
uniref:Uncharacterized protein n=1 Tax=Rhizophora mucronata TaxID=61149 RepID=A0A2P2INT1_RHIMU